MEIFDHDAVNIQIVPEDKMLYVCWKKGSLHIDDDFFKEINLKYLEIITKHQLKIFLINAVDLDFPISIELQEWVAVNIINETKKLGVLKLAIVLSQEIVTQISIEQTLQVTNVNPRKKTIGYFNNEEEAINWLKA